MSFQMLGDCPQGVSQFRFRVSIFLLACIVSCGIGCGGSVDLNSEMEKNNSTNAQRLATLYSQYQREHKGVGPKSEVKFKEFISGMNPTLLERIDVNSDSIDELFVSKRDGQPYKIRWGVKGNDRSDPAAVVFEQEGVDGKRMVAFTRQEVKEVEDEAEYKALLGQK